VRDDSDVNGELLTQLEKELNEAWDQLKTLKNQLKDGEISLEQYQEQKPDLEGRIDDLSQRIFYINKARQQVPTNEERIQQEAEAFMNEYQVEYVDNEVSHLRIFLTVSAKQTWVIEINFSDPKVPLFKIPSDMPSLIGNIYETIDALKKWKGSPNQRLVNIIREIEQKLLDLEYSKSLPELELERGRLMAQAKKLENDQQYESARIFYTYAADISEKLGNQAIAMTCRLKAQKMSEKIEEEQA
jgi:cell division septum initiation protein DivIVA